MANQLKVATVHSIQTLWERGWPQRRIARTLGIHRETVARYVRLSGAGCGSPKDDLKPAKPAHGSGPLSQCEPYREFILAALEQGLSFQRIWQDLRFDHGFVGSYDSV